MEQSSSNIMLCVRDARKSERIELSQLNDALMEKFRHGKFLSREFFSAHFFYYELRFHVVDFGGAKYNLFSGIHSVCMQLVWTALEMSALYGSNSVWDELDGSVSFGKSFGLNHQRSGAILGGMLHTISVMGKSEKKREADKIKPKLFTVNLWSDCSFWRWLPWIWAFVVAPSSKNIHFDRAKQLRATVNTTAALLSPKIATDFIFHRSSLLFFHLAKQDIHRVLNHDQAV